MTVTLSTDLLPIVVPDTYGSELQYEVRDECWDEVIDFMREKAECYIKDALMETDLGNVKLTMGKFKSPREYNFGTDWFLFDIEIPDDYTEQIKSKIDETYMDWVREKYHSRDGFISFVPMSEDKMFEALDAKLNDYLNHKEIAIATWLMYQLKDYPDQQRDYFEDIWERCSMNCWNYDDEEDEE